MKGKKRRFVVSSDDGGDNDDDTYEPSQKPLTRKKKREPNASGDIGPNSGLPSGHSKSLHTIASVNPVRACLLDWYAQVHERRGMPWRKPYDPSLEADGHAQRAYEVWISEIMLQQTQVATVIPYYNRWMEKFPTIKALAASDIETVNGLWKGLGYYSRAARLLSGAKKVEDQFHGRLPDNARDLEAQIPGIGRYSSGAIASISYNECVPVLDGNVHRLLSRVLALHAPPKAKATLDVLWEAATAMVKNSDRPGDINQAMIELGSTVCKVRDPDCGACPLQRSCQAYKITQGQEATPTPDIEEVCTLCESLSIKDVTAYPMKVERKKAREELDIVNVVEWRNEENRWFLLVRRPERGLLAGLYEFPTLPNVSPAISASARNQIPSRLLSSILAVPVQPQSSVPNADADEETIRIKKIQSAGDVLHVFSHIRKTYRVQWVVLEGGGNEQPPTLAPDPEAVAALHAKKVKDRSSASSPTSRSAVSSNKSRTDRQKTMSWATWVLLDGVAKANIGTGVQKIWDQTQAMWSN